MTINFMLYVHSNNYLVLFFINIQHKVLNIKNENTCSHMYPRISQLIKLFVYVNKTRRNI